MQEGPAPEGADTSGGHPRTPDTSGGHPRTPDTSGGHPRTPGQPSADAFRAPVGTHDVLPPESGRWSALVAKFAARAARFGYGLVMTPAYEHVEVFQRLGEGTDVVRKEMYEFEDKGGRRLALRPEGTAPVVRAYIQHRPTPPWKVWYLSPHFRHEKAQRGRYRQHHQLGAEVLGVDDPALDVEVISLAQGFLVSLGLTRFRLAINSLGDGQCRPGYIEALRSYLRTHVDELCADSRSRLEANPLRVLDCKVPGCVAVTERAPQLLEHLCADCKTHFEAVQAGLDAIGVPHEIAPRLVRGLDYYTRTTFEFASEALDSAQNALGGGGRYDRLAEEMGGPPSPGIGFGIGIERVLIACDAEGVMPTPKPYLDAYVVDAVGTAGVGGAPLGTAGAEVAALLGELRETGLAADRAYGGRSVRAQTKSADRSGARYVVLIGRAEMEKGAVAVRDMESGEQVEVPRSRIVAWLHDHLDPTHRDAGR